MPLPERLFQALERMPAARAYRVGFSGGLDSTVLLHAAAVMRGRLAGPLRAVHIDHGLSPRSGAWAAHCAHICAHLKIPCDTLRIEVSAGSLHGPEAAARNARYRALARLLEEQEMLLTAHHRDDQAETVLLQLMRGGGVHGLAAMPPVRRFAAGWLGRPLLEVERSEMRAYAEAEGLAWIEDPSNFDVGFERNFVRHELVPVMDRRRPGVARVLARSAGHFAEAAGLLDALAADDMERHRAPGGTLSASRLAALDPPRARNLLRYWLRARGFPLPDAAHLARIVGELLPAGPDAEPRVGWNGVEVRRYRDRICALPPLPPPPTALDLAWDGEGPLQLPNGLGTLEPQATTGAGLARVLFATGAVRVRVRQGGERCRPPGRPTRELKKLFQEAGVPPWVRERTPLLFAGGELALVPGLCGCSAGAARSGEPGVEVDWRPGEALRQCLAADVENQVENHDNWRPA